MEISLLILVSYGCVFILLGFSCGDALLAKKLYAEAKRLSEATEDRWAKAVHSLKQQQSIKAPLDPKSARGIKAKGALKMRQILTETVFSTGFPAVIRALKNSIKANELQDEQRFRSQVKVTIDEDSEGLLDRQIRLMGIAPPIGLLFTVVGMLFATQAFAAGSGLQTFMSSVSVALGTTAVSGLSLVITTWAKSRWTVPTYELIGRSAETIFQDAQNYVSDGTERVIGPTAPSES